MKKNYDFSVGDILCGTITKILPFGVLVALDNNVQGLVHISHLHTKFVNNINDFFALHDKVTVKVLNIDSTNNKIALSIKDALDSNSKSNLHTILEPTFDKQKTFIKSTKPIETTEKSHFETIMSNWQKESIDKIESINRRTKRHS